MIKHFYAQIPLWIIILVLGFWQSTANAQSIVVFGDSITNGYAIPAGQKDWVQDLISDLPNTYSYGDVLALNGSTLLLNPVDGSSFQAMEASGITADATTYAKTGNIFIIMLGTNDSKSDNEAGDASSFVNDYKTLLNNITSNGTKHPTIFITTPPPIATDNIWGMDSAYAKGTLSNLILSLSGYDGAQVINLNSDLNNAFTQNQALYLTANDGAHPTAAGDVLIANDIYNAIVAPEPSTSGMFAIGAVAVIVALIVIRRKMALQPRPGN